MATTSVQSDRGKSNSVNFEVEDNVMSLIYKRNAMLNDCNKTIDETKKVITVAEKESSNINAVDAVEVGVLSEDRLPATELQISIIQANRTISDVNDLQSQISSAMTEIEGIDNMNKYLIIGVIVLIVLAYLVLFR